MLRATCRRLSCGQISTPETLYYPPGRWSRKTRSLENMFHDFYLLSNDFQVLGVIPTIVVFSCLFHGSRRSFHVDLHWTSINPKSHQCSGQTLDGQASSTIRFSCIGWPSGSHEAVIGSSKGFSEEHSRRRWDGMFSRGGFGCAGRTA